MKHVSQVNIASYRGLSDIEIGGLTDVNVFLGTSNSGKTSALEAIYLASSVNEIEDALMGIIRSRGLAGHESAISLFPRLNADGEIDVALSKGDLDGGDHVRVRVCKPDARHETLVNHVTQQGANPDACYFLDVEVNAQINGVHSNFQHQCALDVSETYVIARSLIMVQGGFPLEGMVTPSYVSPAELTEISVFDQSYSNAYLQGTLPNLLESLRSIYPHLVDIRPVKLSKAAPSIKQPVERWMSYVTLSDGVSPMFVMGDGFKAAMVLLSHALSPGLLLFDTPEAFQHVEGLEVLSRSITEAAGGLGSQIIIATQSLEFLDILLRDCREREVNVSVTRFEHKEEGIVTYRPLSGRETLEDRHLIGVDPRR